MNSNLTMFVAMAALAVSLVALALKLQDRAEVIEPTGDPVVINCETEGVEWINCN